MSATTSTQTLQHSSSPDDEPQLSLQILTRPDDKIAALRLIADSIAQQRQIASRALIFHPLCLSALIATTAAVHALSGIAQDDYSAMLITYSGVVLAYLLAVRYVTSAYIQRAESTNWITWLKGPGGKDDVVFGARYGTEIIAALVLRVPDKKDAKDCKAVVRAWTTRKRYRGKGLGGDMLLETVKFAKKARGEACDVVFAEDHANGYMPLQSMFNGKFRERDARAVRALGKAMALGTGKE